MATVLCSGPSQWFVNTGADVGLDGAGRGDWDRQIMNVTAGISGDMCRWNEPVMDNLKNFVNDSTLTAGTWPSGTFGTLLRAEEKAFSLCIVSMFGQKGVFTAAGMHPCWTFGMVFPLPLRRNLSMKATRERIAFECLTVMDGTGGGVLYTHELPALPEAN